MPKYINKKLQKYSHTHPKHPQHVPFPAPPVKYVKSAQKPNPTDTSPYLDLKVLE